MVKKATTCDVVCPVVIEPVDVWKMYIFNCIDVRWSIVSLKKRTEGALCVEGREHVCYNKA